MSKQATKAIATASQAGRYLRTLLDVEREEIVNRHIRAIVVPSNPAHLPYSFRCCCGAVGWPDIEAIQHAPRCRFLAKLAQVDAVEAWLDSMGPHPDDVDPLEDDWMRDPEEGDR